MTLRKYYHELFCCVFIMLAVPRVTEGQPAFSKELMYALELEAFELAETIRQIAS